MLVLVRCIHSLSSCLLVMALIPLQLRVAILKFCWYAVVVAAAGVGLLIGTIVVGTVVSVVVVVVVCSSCALRSGSCMAGAGTCDRRRRCILRPCCFLVFRLAARVACAVVLRVPLCVLLDATVGGEISCRALRLRLGGVGVVAANPARLVEALQGSREV